MDTKLDVNLQVDFQFTNIWENNSECILLIHPSFLAFDVSLQQFSSRGTETLCVITSDNAINSNKNFALRHHIYVS